MLCVSYCLVSGLQFIYKYGGVPFQLTVAPSHLKGNKLGDVAGHFESYLV